MTPNNSPLKAALLEYRAKVTDGHLPAYRPDYESSWQEIQFCCQNNGMEHRPDNSNQMDIIAFIRTLAQRAGEVQPTTVELKENTIIINTPKLPRGIGQGTIVTWGSYFIVFGKQSVTTRADTRPDRKGDIE